MHIPREDLAVLNILNSKLVSAATKAQLYTRDKRGLSLGRLHRDMSKYHIGTARMTDSCAFSAELEAVPRFAGYRIPSSYG